MKNDVLYIKCNLEGKLCEEYTSLDCDNNAKIEEVITADNNDKNEVKDAREENRQMWRKKLHQKRVAVVAKAKTCQQVSLNVDNN